MLKRINFPDARCVSLDKLKAHLRVDHSNEDEDIADKLDAAIQDCADYCSRAFNQCRYMIDFTCWGGAYEIPIAPVVSVFTVKYYDANGDLQTVDPESWNWRSTEAGAVVYFAPDFVFPDLAPWPASLSTIQIELEAGYDPEDTSQAGDPELQFPPMASAAVLLTAANLYENRERVIVGKTAMELPAAAARFLWALRIFR